MSYATPPPPAKRRPAVVTVASYLLCLVAVLQAFAAVLQLSQVGTLSEIYEEVFRDTELESQIGLTTATAVGSAILWLLVAAGLVVLAIFNAKGKNPARIVTWVVG